MAVSLISKFSSLQITKVLQGAPACAFSTTLQLNKKILPWRIKVNNEKTLAQFKSPTGRESFDKMHFSPIFKPAYEEPKPKIKPSDYNRSFDRKDMGHKPKPRLEIKSTKFFPVNLPEKYTPEPLKTQRTGGRHPLTGRVIYRRIGGGVRPDYLWVDRKREYIPDSETPIEEKVLEIRRGAGPNSYTMGTAHKALVGYQDQKRWIIATENMKPGQIIRSSRAVGRMSIRAFEGDTYAVGALPLGTLVNSVESVPGTGTWASMAAGTSAQILKKEAGCVVIQLPSKQEIKVSEKCIATVGKVSNPEWIDWNWGKAGETRRRGIRPKSGLWHRKDGYCGKKINPPKPLRSYLTPISPKKEVYHLSPV